MPKIPKTLHLCFGLAPRNPNIMWDLAAHVCVRSAIERIRPDRVRFYTNWEPTGPWWRLTRPLVEVVKTEAPTEIFGVPLRHYAHRADVLRLQVLLEQGGIYLDSDVFVHRSFDDLLDHDVVIGREGHGDNFRGLCNAVILARPGAPFLRRWYESYRSFRSDGKEFWAEHSVSLPARLAETHPDEVTVLPHDAFHWPLHTPEGLAQIFGPWPGHDPRSSYANHLWASAARRYLWDLTPGTVRRVDTAFHRWARPFLEDLPDEYGAPTLALRLQRRLRRLRLRFLGTMRRAEPARS
ncbi:glycosyltransferase family 32 protein [Elioraea thermophila]|uniref:glycosyltransferase family 32 protein n=1 Tax=Elioraea thermophila TaxID=2185104 RepID=UPI0018E52F8B|nr:glycosyltransferase [Elioraea thermophila]